MKRVAEKLNIWKKLDFRGQTYYTWRRRSGETEYQSIEDRKQPLSQFVPLTEQKWARMKTQKPSSFRALLGATKNYDTIQNII